MQVSHKFCEYRKNSNLFDYNCPSLCKVKTNSLSLCAETPLTSVAPLLSSLPPRLLNQSEAPLQAHLLSLLFFSYPTSIFLLALNFRPTYVHIAKEAQPANRYTIERRKESLDVTRSSSNQSCLLLPVCLTPPPNSEDRSTRSMFHVRQVIFLNGGLQRSNYKGVELKKPCHGNRNKLLHLRENVNFNLNTLLRLLVSSFFVQFYMYFMPAFLK